MVDYWCFDKYMEKHLDYKNRPAAMVDPPHHQGSLNLKGYAQNWVCLSSHRFVLHKFFHVIHVAKPYDEIIIMLLWLQAAHNNAPEPNLSVSYALANKGPFKVAKPYDENYTSSLYTNAAAYNRLSKFKTVAREMKGLEYDVTSEPLDHELVMISGEGRKHGTKAIGHGMFPRSSCRTLPEIKARQTSSSSSIRKCSTPAMVEMEVFYTSPSI
jgi:hypothetical protein